jgi:hypothetical protein
MQTKLFRTLLVWVVSLGCTALKPDADPVGADVLPPVDAPSLVDAGPRSDVPSSVDVVAPDGSPPIDVPSSVDVVAPDGSPPTDGAVSDPRACPYEQPIMLGASVRGSTLNPGWSDDLLQFFTRNRSPCSSGLDANLTRGPYQVYALDMPAGTLWTVTLTPDADVQTNLAAVWRQAPDDRCAYFLTLSTGTQDCISSLRRSGGAPERSARVSTAGTPSRVVILVNTPQGGTRGGFVLRVAP